MFRDEDDRTVVTFSPYHDISSDVAGEIFLPGYDVCFLQALFPQKCRVTSSKLHGEFPQYCISPSGTLLGAGEEPLQAYKVY